MNAYFYCIQILTQTCTIDLLALYYCKRLTPPDDKVWILIIFNPDICDNKNNGYFQIKLTFLTHRIWIQVLFQIEPTYPSCGLFLITVGYCLIKLATYQLCQNSIWTMLSSISKEHLSSTFYVDPGPS